MGKTEALIGGGRPEEQTKEKVPQGYPTNPIIILPLPLTLLPLPVYAVPHSYTSTPTPTLSLTITLTLKGTLRVSQAKVESITGVT